MATSIGGVEIEIRGDDSDFTRTMRDVRREAGRTGQTMTREFRQAETSARALNSSMMGVRGAIAGVVSVLASGAMAKSIIDAADAFAGMRSRIALSISAADDLLAVEKQLYDQAVANRAALEPTVALYQRLRGARADLTNQQTLAITDAWSKTLIVSGASAQGAASATLQFSQAIAGGVLRAEEFNSIIESNIRFVKLLADSLGVSVGEIRNLVNQGVITTETIFKALADGTASLGDEFDKIPLTVSSAMTNVSNAFVAYIGNADQAAGTSAKLAGFINSVASDFDRLADMVVVAVATVGGAVAGLAAARVVGGLYALTVAAGSTTSAMVSLRGAMAFFGGPIGLAITAVAGAFAYMAITAEDALDKISGASQEYERLIGKVVSSQEDLKKQYVDLERLNREMAQAIEDGASAAELASSREIDAVQLRIDKNKELIAVYEQQIAAALDNARAGRDQARNDFSSAIGLGRRFDYGTNPQAKQELEEATRAFQQQLAAQRATGRALDDNQKKARDFYLAWQQAEQQIASLSKRQLDRVIGAGVAGMLGESGIVTPAPGGTTTTGLTDAEKKAAADRAKKLADQLQLLSGLEREQALSIAIASGNQELVDILETRADIESRMQDLIRAGIPLTDARIRAENEILDIKRLQAETDKRAALSKDVGDLLGELGGQAQDNFDADFSAMIAQLNSDVAFREAIANQIAAGLEQGIRTGDWGDAFKNILANATSDALSDAINNLATALSGIIASAFEGSKPGSIGSFVASIFGGGRAAGGSVAAGMRYIVGEQGPEMFVPSVPGSIVPQFEGPSSAALNGVPGIQSLSISAPFIVQGSITEEVLPRVQAMMAAQARQLPRVIDARVADSIRRNRY
jgi:tape measure domain-containing protein